MSEMPTLFKQISYFVSSLRLYNDNGDLGLPDIQCPLDWIRKKSLGATERNEVERAAWRIKASKLQQNSLSFLMSVAPTLL